jgi:hypothetical protein
MSIAVDGLLLAGDEEAEEPGNGPPDEVACMRMYIPRDDGSQPMGYYEIALLTKV